MKALKTLIFTFLIAALAPAPSLWAASSDYIVRKEKTAKKKTPEDNPYGLSEENLGPVENADDIMRLMKTLPRARVEAAKDPEEREKIFGECTDEDKKKMEQLSARIDTMGDNSDEATAEMRAWAQKNDMLITSAQDEEDVEEYVKEAQEKMAALPPEEQPPLPPGAAYLQDEKNTSEAYMLMMRCGKPETFKDEQAKAAKKAAQKPKKPAKSRSSDNTKED